MGVTITNFWKLFCYGVKIDHYETLIGIREFLEILYLDCSKSIFSTDTSTPEKNIPLFDEVDDGETVSTCRALHFYSYYYFSTDVSNIYNTTLNSDSSSAYNMVYSTIKYQHTAENKGLGREGGIIGLLDFTVMGVCLMVIYSSR